ncbi:MAG: SRPBCC family protein, partial [Flavobacteriaceae bacterium]|nr:SRPBCC family protein [Flavobacteriaceae bacterium]
MKTVKIIITLLIILTVLFFGTGLIIKESSYTSKIIINEPLEKTFSTFTDLSAKTQWNPEYNAIEVIELKPGITGSIYNIKVLHNNQITIIREKVLAYVKNEKITLFIDKDGVVERDDYTFSSDGSQTVINLSSSYQAKSYLLSCVLPFYKFKFKKIDEVF